jgi:Bacterial PH domain
MGTNERMRRLYANHLGREERVLASVRGTVETGRGEPWTGLLLATDRRLAFIEGDTASYLPYADIERIGRGKSLLGGYVDLTAGGHAVRVKWISARRVGPFVRTLRSAVRKSRPRRRRRSPVRAT